MASQLGECHYVGPVGREVEGAAISLARASSAGVCASIDSDERWAVVKPLLSVRRAHPAALSLP